jgi:hypothetical protein
MVQTIILYLFETYFLVIMQLKLHILLLKISTICNIATVNTAHNKKETMTHSGSNNKNSRHGGPQGRAGCQGHVGGPVNLQQQQ